MPDPVRLWKMQPEEKLEMNMQLFMDRRARELSSKTRLDIIGSVAAAVFFLAVITWRFALVTTPFQYAAMALIATWILISVYRFRDRLRTPSLPPPDAAASTGLEYYRQELLRRREHLQNAWIWTGPLFLAVAFFVATVAGSVWPNWQHLQKMLPFVLLFAIWIPLGISMRRKQVRQIQEEIDELDQLR